MAVTREASTVWQGTLREGKGISHLDSSNLTQFDVTWASRFAPTTDATSPEELIASAHATCFAMFFANVLTSAGYTPEEIRASAVVTLDMPESGPVISTSHLLVNATVPGIDQQEFETLAEQAKSGCPVSQALAGVKTTMEASLA